MVDQLTHLKHKNNKNERKIRLKLSGCFYILIFFFLTYLFGIIRQTKILSDNQDKAGLIEKIISVNSNNYKIDAVSQHCKTLWFAGFYCSADSFTKYSSHYVAALQSTLERANNVLQPVVLMGFLGVDNKTKYSTEVRAFAKWAEDLGVKVVALDQLSFSNLTNKYLVTKPLWFQQGPYLRFDIPNVIEQYDLYNHNVETICNDAVLYTDSDVVFTKVSFSDLVKAKSLVTSSNTASMVAYGPEFTKPTHIKKTHKAENTGVMIMNPSRFQLELPKILNFAVDHKFGNGSWHDQDILNSYFNQPGGFSQKSSFLPTEWNYKPYWGKSSNIKIVHFHGIKPGRLLDCLASSNMASPLCENDLSANLNWILNHLVSEGLETDGGAYAREVLDFYYALPSWDGSNKTPEKEKYNLYINGPKRGKCNWDCYYNAYNDIPFKNPKRHFVKFGISEGRNCACTGITSKIAAKWTKEITSRKRNMLEGRIEARKCNWDCYLNRYEDLQRKFGGMDQKKAKDHYLKHGYQEDRNCTCPTLDPKL